VRDAGEATIQPVVAISRLPSLTLSHVKVGDISCTSVHLVNVSRKAFILRDDSGNLENR
jgi:hypothetical protein